MQVLRFTALALAMAFLLPAGLDAQQGREAPPANDPEITEWTVPYDNTRPRDPMVGPDGRVFFVGQTGDYISALNPLNGEFQRWDLDARAGPHNLIVRDDGAVFYAGNRVNHIGRLDTETGEIEKFMMPDERARDPHTLVWTQDSNIWFTVQQGNFVGYFQPGSGDVRLVEMPQVPGRGGQMGSSRPYGIKMDSNDHPWIVLFNSNQIVTIDPDTFEPTVFELPNERTRPRRMVIDSQDQVWYVDYALGSLGVLNPETGEIKEWPMPGGQESRPYGMAIDKDDRIWFVETGLVPNRFVGFDPAIEEFISDVEVGSSRGAIRHMYYDDSNNTIWFGTDWNTVGKAVLPPLKRVISF